MIQRSVFQAFKIKRGYSIQKNSIKELIGHNFVRQFALKFAKIESQNPSSINLSLGVPFNVAPKCIIEAKLKYLNDSAEPGKNGYGDPGGLKILRENLSKYYQQTYNIPQKDFNEDNVVITPGGTSNSLSLALEMIGKKHNSAEVIVLAPFFGPYEGIIKLANMKPIIVDTNQDFTPNNDNIEKSITKNTKAIIINSPNNPSGRVYSYKQYQDIIQIAKKNQMTVISDEIYERFVYLENTKYTSITQFYENDLNLITVCSPSKTFGMIGDRIGYILSTQKDFIEDITITLGYRFASSPYLSQYAMNSVFSNDKEISQYVSEQKNSYKQKAKILVNGLRQMGFDAVDLEGGMFLMVNVRQQTNMDGMEFSTYCMNQEIPLAISPGQFFGQNFVDCVRFTICPTLETIEKGIKLLEVYLKRVKQQSSHQKSDSKLNI